MVVITIYNAFKGILFSQNAIFLFKTKIYFIINNLQNKLKLKQNH